MRRGDLVILHLINPTEKFWGVLDELMGAGIVLRAINVNSFDEWMNQAARREPLDLGLVTMFVPLFRVERMFLDEQVGEVESYAQRFARHVGLSVHEFLGLADSSGDRQIPS